MSSGAELHIARPADPASGLDARARVFQALSDPKRLEILQLLASGERCVCDLQDDLGLAQSLLSFHLKTLRDSGLVAVRRSGRWAHYSLAHATLHAAEHSIADLQKPLGPPPPGCCGQPTQTLAPTEEKK